MSFSAQVDNWAVIGSNMGAKLKGKGGGAKGNSAVGKGADASQFLALFLGTRLHRLCENPHCAR